MNSYGHNALNTRLPVLVTQCIAWLVLWLATWKSLGVEPSVCIEGMLELRDTSRPALLRGLYIPHLGDTLYPHPNFDLPTAIDFSTGGTAGTLAGRRGYSRP